MATIRYTHFFSLIYWVCMVWYVLFMGSFWVTEKVFSFIAPETPFYGLLKLCVLFGSGYGLFKGVVAPLYPLPTWLYLRIVLFVPATWGDAKDTAFLFEENENGKWYPLTELRKIPRKERREVLREFAQRVRNSKKETARPQPIHYEGSRIAHARRVLGVSAEASPEDLKNAYRRLMKKYHPDVYANAESDLQDFANEKARELNEAYELLSSLHKGAA